MKAQDYVKPAKGGCVLSVDVSPGADRTEIMGINPWRGSIQIRVAAQPKEGEANDALVRFLSSRLRIPPTSITIVRGVKSSHKTILVPLEAEKVMQLLEGK